MNFRRPPFQFSTIDPAKRQAELQKRFGLPSNNNDMLADFLNPGIVGSRIKEPTVGGSPRLQHRVPVFKETADKVNSEQNNVDGGHKPRVRVVPIQVEGVDTSKRQCTFSAPVGMERSNGIFKEKLRDPFPQSKVEQVKKPSQPRVCNIPIQIEHREENPKVVSSPAEIPKVEPEKLKVEKEPEPVKKLKTESNGCTDSREKGPNKNVPLQQIEAVRYKLKEYTDKVDKFSGTVKDKQYRYLDEMLTRCMLDLDNVDTMGLDEIRKARKEAVRKVQHYVDLLDTKVNEPVDAPSKDNFNSNDTELVPTENNDGTIPDTNVNEDVEMNGDVTTECADPVSLNESNDLNNCDVDMEEDKSSNILNSEITNDSLTVSNVAEPIDGAEMVSSEQDLKDTAAEIESTPCDISESGVVIEELEDSTVCAAETVPCVVSDSPELSVKETIFEECDSDILIEEVEENSEPGKDIVNSDSSVDTKLTVEQLNFGGNCGETETKSFPDTSTVVQKNIDDFEKQ